MREGDESRNEAAQARKWRTIFGIAVLVCGAVVAILQPERLDFMDVLTVLLAGSGGLMASWGELKRVGRKVAGPAPEPGNPRPPEPGP